MGFMNLGWRAWTELVWLRTRRGGILLCVRPRTFDFIKWGGGEISGIAEDLFTSQEEFCYVDLVNHLNL
jgi:hypothetical protein